MNKTTKNPILDRNAVLAIARNNNASGYKEFQGDITLWKSTEVLPGYVVRSYLTFMLQDGNYVQFNETWVNTTHNPVELLSLDSMGR